VQRRENAGKTIVLVLAAFLAVGIVLVFAAPATPLLIIAGAAAVGLAALSVFVARKTAALKAAQFGIYSQQRSAWLYFTRPQWMMLTSGLTATAVLVGAGAGVRLVDHPVEASAGPPAATTAAAPPPAAPTTSAAAEPSPSDSVTDSPSPSDVPTDTPTGTDTPAPAPGSITYLDSTASVNGYFNASSVNLSGKRYPRSVVMTCYSATGNYVEWNVAGNKRFSTTAGIPDDASNTFGAIAEVIVYDQDGHQLGKPFDFSVGHPVPISLDIKGVVRLRVTCSGRDGKTGDRREFGGALGDAIVSN
jgi:hypothetical protein